MAAKKARTKAARTKAARTKAAKPEAEAEAKPEESGERLTLNNGGFENRTALAKPEAVNGAGQNNGGYENRAAQHI